MLVFYDSITNAKVDAIVNAANGCVGCMGAGVAKAIRDKGGIEIETLTKELCRKYKFKEGTAYYTKAGLLDAKFIIHAVTMKYPGERSSIETVEKCIHSIFETAKKLNCGTIALPGLGTNIGKVPVESVASLYVSLIPSLEEKYGIEVSIFETNRYLVHLITSRLDYLASTK